MSEREWEEWIDRDLRGEITDAERVGVLEKLRQNPARFAQYSEDAETARRICDGLQATRAALPSDFFETRLKKALDESPAWARFAERRAQAVVDRLPPRKSKRFVWSVVASAASVAVVASVAVGAWSFGRGKPNDARVGQAPNANAFASNVGSTSEAASVAKANASDPSAPYVLRIPSAAGAAPNETLELPNDECWANFRVEKERSRAFCGEFQRYCSSLNVAFDKFDGDTAFLLKRVSPEQWGQIADWLATKAAEQAAEQAAENAAVGADLAPVVALIFTTSPGVDARRSDAAGKPFDVRVDFALD